MFGFADEAIAGTLPLFFLFDVARFGLKPPGGAGVADVQGIEGLLRAGERADAFNAVPVALVVDRIGQPGSRLTLALPGVQTGGQRLDHAGQRIGQIAVFLRGLRPCCRVPPAA